MHGRPRVPVSKSESEEEKQKAAANRKKAALYGKLLGEVLASHKAKDYSKEALDRSARLLELNPEVSTAWNHRRKAVLAHLNDIAEEAAKAARLEEELRLVERALQKNHKSYGAWYHRAWTIDAMGQDAPMEREMKLVSKLLSLDPRNFHGWGYRRLAAARAKRSDEEELKYTLEKIEENFSNYSAWHQRSSLLPKVHAGSSWLDAEFDLVKNAFYTEPDDQSGWMYHLWLLQHIVPSSKSMRTTLDSERGVSLETCSGQETSRGGPGEGNDGRTWRVAALEKEVQMCRELLELEPDSKWALLTLSRLLSALHGLGQGQLAGDLAELYARLVEIDPAHEEYYSDLRGQLALEEALRLNANKEKSLGRLELSKLQLARVALAERFLWVQHLDLSHNNLRSVEGLESSKLLVTLDLSHNRITHASGLAPLHAMSQLRSLNISFNRLGDLAVDFCLYCIPARTLKRAEGDDEQAVRTLGGVLGGLGGLQLESLSIVGNRVATVEGCRAYLFEMLPKLVGLNDGVV